jgi:hypothetical protein
METDARCGVEVARPGCFFSMVIVAASLLTFGWLFGEVALTHVPCSNPECARWSRQLNRSIVSSLAGMGCLALAGLNIRTGVFLLLGVEALSLTTLAGLGNPGMALLVAIDLLLVAAVGGWYLAGWLDA